MSTNSQPTHSPALNSDVVGVIAGFLPATTEHQQPLMLVCHSWYRGVVEQDGMAPKPGIRWPMGALRMRGSRLVLPADHDERCFEQLAEQYPDVAHISVPYTTKVSAEGLKALSQLKQVKLTATANYLQNGASTSALQRQDCFVGGDTVQLAPTTTNEQKLFNEMLDPDCISEDMLPQFVEMLKSDDSQKQLHGTIMIRKLLCKEEDLELDSKILKLLGNQLLCDDRPKLQFQSAWALTNAACNASTELMECVVNFGDHVLRLLSSPDLDCREQAAWALGNIASIHTKVRDLVNDIGALEKLIEVVEMEGGSSTAECSTAGLNLRRTAVWAMSNLCRGKPQPEFMIVADAAQTFSKLIHDSDRHVVCTAAWGLSRISDDDDDRIQEVLDCGYLSHMMEFLEPTHVALLPAVSFVGNIASGNDTQTQQIIDGGALSKMKTLLEHEQTASAVRKEMCWCLSNILAGSQEQIQAVTDAGLIPVLLKETSSSNAALQKEATWCIANASSGTSEDQLRHLVADCNALKWSSCLTTMMC